MALEPRGQRSAPVGPHGSGGQGGADSEHQHQDFLHRESAVTQQGVRGMAAGLRAAGLCGSGLWALITGVSQSTTLSHAEFLFTVPPSEEAGRARAARDWRRDSAASQSGVRVWLCEGMLRDLEKTKIVI